MHNNQKVTLVLDLQFGSTGKGKVVGLLAEKMKPDLVINANMPNAGHTYINASGRTWVHKVLPNGIVSPAMRYCLLGAGSVFDINQLRKEMSQSGDLINLQKLKIHESAVVLSDKHREAEAGFDRIGSTRQGSAEAVIEKMRRDPENSPVAKDVLIGTEFEQCVIRHHDFLALLLEAREILAEGAQGYSLGINAGFWPYCTSRDCTTPRLLAEMGIPHTFLKNVVGVARTYPIRVGGTSGGGYNDQHEINWEDIGQTPELTTVTKKQRRIFNFSSDQMTEAVLTCQPTHIVLNFADYIKDQDNLNQLCSHIDAISAAVGTGGVVGMLGTGGGYQDHQILSESFVQLWN